MNQNVTQKLIESHLISGQMNVGDEILLKVDQTLTQDATGTLVLLEFEALGLPHIKTEVSVQYVDHNLLQEDHKNGDDHLFLRSACQKFGLWYSRPGNGVSHPLHMERFGIPGKTLLGSDSHTSAAGALGMLGIGAGGLDVAMAMAGEPFHLRMPQIFGIRLTGRLPDWVSAKDIILEMLRRHRVSGGVGIIFEYYGPGLETLSAMDRHVIANMGAEMGATSTVFPSDEIVRGFMKSQHREKEWKRLEADEGAMYDREEEIDLSTLEPLIACPSSPDNVVLVRDVAGKKIYQSYIGSSANPGLRDFAMAALIVDQKTIHPEVSFDINPTTRQILENLVSEGYMGKLLRSGARFHQTGCNGCIGMGQAPATGRISLRTVPRNFPGRSGTREDQVYLCSPETAAASALTGMITDPRTLEFPYPVFHEPKSFELNEQMMEAPLLDHSTIALVKGPNIKALPIMDPLPDVLEGPILLKADNNVSTDEILPAGARVLPFRSNIPELSRFAFSRIDPHYATRAETYGRKASFVVGGENYGQGSSREHAALAPRYLGLCAVLALSFARIHRQNLINFGILPLVFKNPADREKIKVEDLLQFSHLREQLKKREPIEGIHMGNGGSFLFLHRMTDRQIKIIEVGGLINLVRDHFYSL
ncbi:MAG: aconitate hydratase [Verrucomicrobiota bacterium]